MQGEGRLRHRRGTESLGLQPLHLSHAFYCGGKWIWRGLETHRWQQEQSPHSWPSLSQTNIHHKKKQQAATSSCVNVCKMHTVGTVWPPSPQDRGTVAALMPLKTHNQRADTLIPSHRVTLTSLKRISWVLRAQRYYRTVQTPVPIRVGLGFSPLSTDTASRPGPGPGPCPFRDNLRRALKFGSNSFR